MWTESNYYDLYLSSLISNIMQSSLILHFEIWALVKETLVFFQVTKEKIVFSCVQYEASTLNDW